VVEKGKAYDSAMDFALTLIKKPKLSLVSIKEAVNQGLELPLSGALAFERKLFELLFDSADQKEGMTAFLEKRQPDYSGNKR
jgi:enoyl-CoA hydratase/carnithine racemase